MNEPPTLLERFGRGLLAGIVLYWAGAITALRSAAGVADWWLPLALALGCCVPAPHGAQWPAATLSWRTRLVAGGLLAIVFGALVYGALATPSRHWDGAVAHDAKIYWLSRAMTLQQPFFADPAVFHHSPDYPLLLSLLVAGSERWLGGVFGAGSGRIWLPLVHALMLVVLASALRRAPGGPRRALGVVLACAVVPALIGVGGGGVDSGYCDPWLLLATTTLAAGLVSRSPWELAFGVVLAVASKPEGPVYASLAMVVAFVMGRRRDLLVLALALAAAMIVWLPTQRQLLHLPPASAAVTWLPPLVMAALVAIAVGADRLVRGTARPMRWRAGLVAAAMLAALLSLPLLRAIVPPTSAVGVYLHRGYEPGRGLANLPEFARAWVDYALLRWGFGGTFVVMLVVVPWRRGRPAAGGGIGMLVGLGLLITALPFVLSHEADLHHHLRSSLPRLLSHWVGPVWLWIGLQLGAGWPVLDAGAAARQPTS
jgi:hypothetical protein